MPCTETGPEACRSLQLEVLLHLGVLRDRLAFPSAVAATTAQKAGFHANRCPHAKSDGTLHLDARRGGFAGAIDWATKLLH